MLSNERKQQISTKWQSIQKQISELDEALAEARGRVLDEDSETEDDVTRTIKSERELAQEGYEFAFRTLPRKRGFAELLKANANTDPDGLLRMLDQFSNKIAELRLGLSTTTLSRRGLQDIASVALKKDLSSNQELSGLSSRICTWTSVNCLDVSEMRNTTLQSLDFSESQLNNWWYGDHSPDEASPVFEDLKRLCLKVVTLRDSARLLESRISPEVMSFRGTMSRVEQVTINLVQLLVKFPGREDDIVPIFALIATVVFAMIETSNEEDNRISCNAAKLDQVLYRIGEQCEITGAQLTAESILDAANDSDENAISRVNPSTFSSSSGDISIPATAREILINTKLVQGEDAVRDKFEGFGRTCRGLVVATFRKKISESHCGLAKTKQYRLEDLKSIGLEEIQVNTESEKEDGGKGSYGVVRMYSSFDGSQKYAVKVAIPRVGHPDNRTWNRIIREADALIKCQNKNVVRLHGYCLLPDVTFPGLVLERYIGNMEKFLRGTEVALVERFILLSDVASGLAHVHKQIRAHGDLRAANVLIRPCASSNKWAAALADFGVSDLISDITERLSAETDGQMTNDLWLAPEFFKKKKKVARISPPADVYAFGCVFIEVISGVKPFDFVDRDSPNRNVGIATYKRRKKVFPAERSLFKLDEEDGEERYYSFITRVCAFTPENRPNAKELYKDMINFAGRVVYDRRGD